jgi:hypothetical protein
MTHPECYKPLHIKQLYFLMTVSHRTPENKKKEKLLQSKKLISFFAVPLAK